MEAVRLNGLLGTLLLFAASHTTSLETVGPVLSASVNLLSAVSLLLIIALNAKKLFFSKNEPAKPL